MYLHACVDIFLRNILDVQIMSLVATIFKSNSKCSVTCLIKFFFFNMKVRTKQVIDDAHSNNCRNGQLIVTKTALNFYIIFPMLLLCQS